MNGLMFNQDTGTRTGVTHVWQVAGLESVQRKTANGSNPTCRCCHFVVKYITTLCSWFSPALCTAYNSVIMA
jgi:hypothetical protein